MRKLLATAKMLYNKKEMILTLTESDFKKRFIGSYFGIVWMFVQPIVSVFIYYFVFQMGFKSNPVDNMPYILWLLPGIVPWFFFNEAVMNGVGCLQVYQHLVKKMVFPVEIIPLFRVMSSMIVHFIFLSIMLAVYLLYGEVPSLWWFQVIYFLVAETILILGIVYLTASINVFVRDMNQIVNICLQFGFWIAPIMWDESIMPEYVRPILKINPFTYIVNGFRDTFIFHKGFWENGMYTLYFWGVTLALFIAGTWMFRRLKNQFVDVL